MGFRLRRSAPLGRDGRGDRRRAARPGGRPSRRRTGPTTCLRCRPAATSSARAARALRVSRSPSPSPSDATSTVQAILQLAVRERVLVSGDTPFVDATTTTTAARSYGGNVILHLPVDRNYADVARDHPGVVTDHGSTQGRSISLAIERLDLRREPVDDRRHLDDPRHGGSAGQGLQQRGSRGHRSGDRRLSGGVRPVLGRRDQRRHEVGWQRLPRRRLRVLRQLEHAGRTGLRRRRGFALKRDAACRLSEDRLGRRPRRIPAQGAALVLRRLQPDGFSRRGVAHRLERARAERPCNSRWTGPTSSIP